jgi:hypothetical protein
LKIRRQFGIRTLLALIFLTAICLLLWQSLPRDGNPILHGHIVDSNGAPIPNVEIVLHSGLATRFPNQTTCTDARGQFMFAPLETGATVYSKNGGFNTMLVGIRATRPGYHAVDGADWWDISVPRINNRKHRWNLVMTKHSADNPN